MTKNAPNFLPLYTAAYAYAYEQARVANVSDAMCGFAWVRFKGNTAWGRWCKANHIATKAYPSGLWIRCHDFNQSWARKRAWAGAFAWYLREHGNIDCVAEDRLD